MNFDFEIFPDNECANVYTCGGAAVPDFTFKVNGVTVPGGHFLASNPPAGARSPLRTSNLELRSVTLNRSDPLKF